MAELGPSPLAAGNELPVAVARQAIADALRPITERETVPLLTALGRVLAEDVVSPIDVPAHDNSAMDGYAFRGAELCTDSPTSLVVTGPTVLAGMLLDQPVQPGQCVRIMTGAVMPAGLDTVVPQELCQVAEGRVSLAAGVLRAGENRRKQGEDLARGKPALTAGRLLVFRARGTDFNVQVSGLNGATPHILRVGEIAHHLFRQGFHVKLPAAEPFFISGLVPDFNAVKGSHDN